LGNSRKVGRQDVASPLVGSAGVSSLNLIFYPKVFTEPETNKPQNTRAQKTQSNNKNIFFPINQSIYGYSITRFGNIVKHTLLRKYDTTVQGLV
jgi:hypothetical protein